jgi:ribosomal protein S18 acetylase RimI-like enzyme
MRSWDDPSHAYLVELAIEKESQGIGLGGLLLQKSLLYLKKKNISSIALTVDPKNSRGLHLYCDKFGFRRIGYRKNEYGKDRHRLVLELDLRTEI